MPMFAKPPPPVYDPDMNDVCVPGAEKGDVLIPAVGVPSGPGDAARLAVMLTPLMWV